MKSGEKFEAAMKTALQAVLCSKDFIYLVEGSAETNTQRLNEWELASRLSYFLWSTMPDAELLDAAKRGVLHEPATLQAQVRRMLADERAHRFTDAFPRQWLQLRRLGMFPPNKKLYPDVRRVSGKEHGRRIDRLLPRSAGEESHAARVPRLELDDAQRAARRITTRCPASMRTSSCAWR